MANFIQATHTNETTASDYLDREQTTLFGGKTDSGLIRFSIQSFLIIAVFCWSQFGNLQQDILSVTPNYLTSNLAVDFASIFPSGQPEASAHSVYSTLQKNRIGSDDDPVRFNPESKSLEGILEPIVKVEVMDESIHPENYTPNTSKAIHREAVNQRSDTFLKEEKLASKVVSKQRDEVPYGTIVYTGEHFKEMENYSATFASINSSAKTNVSPRNVAHKVSNQAVQNKTKQVKKRTTSSNKKKIKSYRLSTVKIASLKHSDIAARENVASITSSDNPLVTKQLNNQLNKLKVDESEAIASASSTSESKPEVTSTQFNDLRAKALADDKMVLVRFTASWCMPCKVMEQNVYANPYVKSYMDQHFLSMKLDIDSFDGINLKQIYNIESLPSFLIFSNKGDVVTHNKKLISAEDMMSLLKSQVGNVNTINDTDVLSKSEYDNGGSDNNSIAR